MISPCAGYLYAGGIYAHVYKSLAEYGPSKSFMILGSNTKGIGCSEVSIMSKGLWITPFGEVKINSMLAEEIKEKCSFVKEESIAHIFESQIEVQLPYIQYIDTYYFGKNNFSFVPIIISSHEKDTCENLGVVISEICKKRHIVIIAIAQFTKYEKEQIARSTDNSLIEAILDMNIEKLMKVVEEKSKMHEIGDFGPTATLLTAAKTLGIKKGKLLGYITSGDIIGDRSSVVAYAGIEIKGE